MGFQRHYAQHKILGKRLRAAREAAGLTQDQAAQKLGFGQPTVSDCETGNRRVDVFELQDFAKAYRTTLGELLGPLSNLERKQLDSIPDWESNSEASD